MEHGYGAAMRTAVIILLLSIVALIAALLLVPRPRAASSTPIIPRAEAAAVDGWERSWHAASARAPREGRPILALFTGSDWCPACIRLKREVFSTPAFRTWADARLVLLELDFPQSSPQPATAAQNEALERHYAVAGFPSVLLLSAEGNELGRIEGLPSGGTDGFIARIEAILARSRR